MFKSSIYLKSNVAIGMIDWKKPKWMTCKNDRVPVVESERGYGKERDENRRK